MKVRYAFSPPHASPATAPDNHLAIDPPRHLVSSSQLDTRTRHFFFRNGDTRAVTLMAHAIQKFPEWVLLCLPRLLHHVSADEIVLGVPLFRVHLLRDERVPVSWDLR